MVIELLNKGAAKVYAASRNTDSLNELKAKYGDRIVPIALDLTNDDSIAAVKDQVKDLDILINNAGVLLGSHNLSGDAISDLENNFEVNVFGLMKLTLNLVDLLKKESPTAIVNLSSLAGLANMPVIGTYSVSKAAVHSITQGLRYELAAFNVLVSGVYPGAIDTEMTKSMDMPKDTPLNVGINIVKGIENGTEYIFPDQMSEQAGNFYLANPQGVEGEFGKYV